jgi:hypothetical protein
LEVFELRGAKLFSSIVKGNITQINCSNFIPGIYFVHVKSGKGIRVLKLIKE